MADFGASTPINVSITRRRRFQVIAVIVLLLLLGIGVFVVIKIRESQAPPSGQAATVDGKCVIGWTSSYKYSGTSVGYISVNQLMAQKPWATYKSFNTAFPVDANNLDLTATNLSDVDVLFVGNSQSNYVPSNMVTPTATQISAIEAMFQQGMSVIVAGDNGQGCGDDAANFSVALAKGNLFSQYFTYYDECATSQEFNSTTINPTGNAQYNVAQGLPLSTVGSALNTPGILVSKGNGASYMSNLGMLGGSAGSTHLVVFRPATSGSGMLFVDSNAGIPSAELLKRQAFWDNIPDCAHAPAAAVCGNGAIETGEQCDDSNTTNGDGCSSTCQITTQCNDGVDNDSDGHIDCQSGNADPGCFPNGSGGGGNCDPTDNTEADAPAICGNSIVETGELCDDGNTTNGDGCSSTCQVTTQCNDGVDNDTDGRIDCVSGNADPGCFPDGRGGGGVCDPTDNTETDTPATCGNNVIESPEQCDDGNLVNGDGCSDTCTITTQCNDGIDNDGDGHIDCQTGNADPGCYPDGNGGGGVCDPTNNTEADSAAPTATCYRCTASIYDANTCEAYTYAGTACPTGSSATAGQCAVANGGACPTASTTTSVIPATGVFDDARFLFAGLVLIASGYVVYKFRIGRIASQKLVDGVEDTATRAQLPFVTFEQGIEKRMNRKIKKNRRTK